MINPVVGGWMRYYGAFYRSALSTLLARINTYLVRWIRKRYKRLRPRRKLGCPGSESPGSIPATSPTGRGSGIP
jgi:Group II intron, maturase-specific domain